MHCKATAPRANVISGCKKTEIFEIFAKKIFCKKDF
jgi:hypothetical protein